MDGPSSPPRCQESSELEASATRIGWPSLRLFDRMGDLVFKMIDIERTDFEDAARLCEDVGLNLRGPMRCTAAVALP